MPDFQMANAGILRDLQPKPYDPVEGMKQAQVIQAQMEAQREKQAAQQREQMIAEVVQQYPNDPDKAIGILKGRDWKAAMVVEEAVTKNRKAIADRRKVEIENQLSQMTVDRGGLSAKDALEAELAAITRGQAEDWANFAIKNEPDFNKAGLMLLGPKGLADIKAKIADQAITMRGQDTTAETARSGQAVTMRGQDIGASTARAGQAVTARGQDIAAGTAAARLALDKSEANKPGAAAKAGPPVAAIIDQIEILSKRLNTSGGGVTSYAQGLMNRGLATMQMQNDMSEYQSLVTGMIPMVARAVGHTGVLTQQDVDSVRNLFPKPQDNKTLAENKIKRVKELIGSAGTAAAPPAPGGGKPADPLGIR